MQLITKSDEILGGIPVFYGTRVPVQNLIDYLTTGETIDTFLDHFPSVKREQVIQFLEIAGAFMIAKVEKILIGSYFEAASKRPDNDLPQT